MSYGYQYQQHNMMDDSSPGAMRMPLDHSHHHAAGSPYEHERYQSAGTQKPSGAHGVEGNVTASPHFSPPYHPPPLIPPPSGVQGAVSSRSSAPSTGDRLDLTNLDIFLNVTARLLSRHAESQHGRHPQPVEEILMGMLQSENEQRAFAETLRTKYGELPTFPEACESATSSLIREADRVFGHTLKQLAETRLRQNQMRANPVNHIYNSTPTQRSTMTQGDYSDPYQQSSHMNMVSGATVQNGNGSVGGTRNEHADAMYQQRMNFSRLNMANADGEQRHEPADAMYQQRMNFSRLNMANAGGEQRHEPADAMYQQRTNFSRSNMANAGGEQRQAGNDGSLNDGRVLPDSGITDRDNSTLFEDSPESNPSQQLPPTSFISRTFTQDTTDRTHSKPPEVQGTFQSIPALSSPVVETQSKMKQHLLDEMEHASQILHSTENEEVRVQYLRHMKDLRLQWEKLKQQPPPQFANAATTPNVSENSETRAVNSDPAQSVEASQQHVVELDERSVRSSKSGVWSVVADEKSVASLPANKPMGKQFVDVVAPDNLPANYSFEARIGDQVFIATVPPSGVVKGQVFKTVMTDIDDALEEGTVRARVLMDMGAPKSKWRDSLFDCFGYGAGHPLLLNSILCPHVALSQIMARMRLTVQGEKGKTLKSRTKVKTLVWLALGVAVMHIMYACFVARAPQNARLYALSCIPLLVMDAGILFYMYYLTARTRKEIRTEYNIPGRGCGGFEDACLSIFCTSCVISQMGRHTADYDTYRANCCTDTGLPNHVEVKLPSDPNHEMS